MSKNKQKKEVFNPALEETRLQMLADTLDLDYYKVQTEVKNATVAAGNSNKLNSKEYYFQIEQNLYYNYICQQANLSMYYNTEKSACKFYAKSGRIVFVFTNDTDKDLTCAFKVNHNKAQTFTLKYDNILNRIQTIAWSEIVNKIEDCFTGIGIKVQKYLYTTLQSVNCTCKSLNEFTLELNAKYKSLTDKDLKNFKPNCYDNQSLIDWIHDYLFCITHSVSITKKVIEEDENKSINFIDYWRIQGGSDCYALSLSPDDESVTVQFGIINNSLVLDFHGLQIRASTLRGLETVFRLDWKKLFTDLSEMIKPMDMFEEEIKLLLDIECNL